MANFDVIVLGGGIIGSALADELAGRGRTVALIDRGTLGSEASSAAAGILASHMDVPTPGPFLDFCQTARRAYPRWVASLRRRTGLPIEYAANGVLYAAMSAREEAVIERRVKWQLKRKFRIERWTPADVRRREPAVDGPVRRGFFFAQEGQVDNAALMAALSSAVRKAGVVVRENTEARKLVVRGRAIQGVETSRGQLRAPVVVNALGSWSPLKGFPLRLPVKPIRGQIVVFDGPPRLFRSPVVSQRAYIIQRRDGRLLLGSTLEDAGFVKALTVKGMHDILCGARRLSSAVLKAPFVEAWSGLRPYSADQLPIIGETPVSGLYAATGHYRHGILLAPTTAALLAEAIISGRIPPALKPYSPLRFRA